MNIYVGRRSIQTDNCEMSSYDNLTKGFQIGLTLCLSSSLLLSELTVKHIHKSVTG